MWIVHPSGRCRSLDPWRALALFAAVASAAVACGPAPQAIDQSLKSMPASESLGREGASLYTLHTGDVIEMGPTQPGRAGAVTRDDSWLLFRRDYATDLDFVFLADGPGGGIPVCEGFRAPYAFHQCALDLGGWGILLAGFGYVPNDVAAVRVEAWGDGPQHITVTPSRGAYMYYVWVQADQRPQVPMPRTESVAFLDGAGNVVASYTPSR